MRSLAAAAARAQCAATAKKAARAQCAARARQAARSAATLAVAEAALRDEMNEHKVTKAVLKATVSVSLLWCVSLL